MQARHTCVQVTAHAQGLSKEKALTNGEINTDIVHVSTYHCNYNNNASLIKNYYAKLKEHPPTENIFNNKIMIYF